MRAWMPRAAAVALSVCACGAPLAAQGVSGTLLRADSVTPAAGVIVVASRPANDSVIARTITSGVGRFSMALAAGPVRLRALRIGQRPFVLGTFTLGASETRELRAVLPNTPIVLAAVTTRGTTVCKQTGVAGEAVAAVFEEARKALLSTQLVSGEGRMMARYSMYTAYRTVGGRESSPEQRTFFEGESSRPFQSLPAAFLAREGYVTIERDGTVYRAPDADVLLSESFASGHCLQLTEGAGDRAAWIGLAFSPAARPREIVDIRGTLWLDRRTAELRLMEFTYDGLQAALQNAPLGGLVEYTRLPNGLWFANRWEIRMPRTALIPQQGLRVTGIQVSGGDVWRMKRGDDLLYTNGKVETSSLSPTVVAMPGGAAPAPSDTLTTLAQCEPTADAATSATIFGRVQDDKRAPLGDAVVTVEWQQEIRAAGSQLSWQTRRLTTTSALDGYFSLCGLPRARLVTLSAQYGSRRSPGVGVRVAESEGTARVDLRFVPARGAAATERGVVVRVRDSSGRPIPYALVEVESGRGRVTDDSGRVLLSVAPDSLKIVARRMGFAKFEGRVGRDASGEFPVLLPRIAQALGTVTVRGQATSPLENAGFYDRMRRSQRGAFVGDFITPEELDSRSGTRLSALFSGRRFVALTRTRGSRPQTYLLGRGGCKMTVFLDGTKLEPEKPTRDQRSWYVSIDDIIDAHSVAAIEIYATAANAPAELIPLVGAADQGACGIVAIWTGSRR